MFESESATGDMAFFNLLNLSLEFVGTTSEPYFFVLVEISLSCIKLILKRLFVTHWL